MKKPRLISNSRVTRSHPLIRKELLKQGYRPIILTDGTVKVWDGFNIGTLDADAKTSCILATGNWQHEIILMCKEHLFPEAEGALIWQRKWFEIQDTLQGFPIFEMRAVRRKCRRVLPS